MKIKVIMDNGKDYIFEGEINSFVKGLQNNMGVVLNGLYKYIDVNDNVVFINPSHISTIQQIL